VYNLGLLVGESKADWLRMVVALWLSLLLHLLFYLIKESGRLGGLFRWGPDSCQVVFKVSFCSREKGLVFEDRFETDSEINSTFLFNY